MNSYRAELSGILGGIVFITLLLRYHHLPMPPEDTFEVYCDNLGALGSLSPPTLHGIKATMVAEYDIINEIRLHLASNKPAVSPRQQR